MTNDQQPRLIITQRDENGIASITSIESRHDAKGALYAQARARARGDVIRFVTRFRSHRVTKTAGAAPVAGVRRRTTRRRLWIGGGAAGWLGLLPLGMYTAGQLGALAAALIAIAITAALLAAIAPTRVLAVLVTAVMLPLHLLTGSGHACSGAHCPGCAG